MIHSTIPGSLLQQAIPSHVQNPNPQERLESSASGRKEATDQLLLSQLSRMIDLLNLEMGQGAAANDEGQGLTLEGVESLKQRGQMMANVLKMKIDGFQQNLLQTLKTNNIDTSKPAMLQDGGDSGILLGNDHPDADKIKSLLQEESGLGSQFKEIARLAELLQGLGRQEAETNELTGSHNPIAAYQQHSRPVSAESNMNGGRFTLRVEAGDMARAF